MKRRRFLLLAGAFALAALMVSGVALAQDRATEEGQEAAGALAAAAAAPLGSGFTYQGQLTQDGEPVAGTCDLRFTLYDAADGGDPVGAPQDVPDQAVTDGYFTVELDFGSGAFNGEARWLGVEVDCEGAGSYTELGRQELTAAPYALHAASTAALLGRPVSGVDPSSGEVLKWDGVQWAPAADEMGSGDGGGDITAVYAGHGLVGGGESGEVTLSASFAGSGGDYGAATNVARSDHHHDDTYWSLTGNAGTTAGTHYLGTTDNVPLELHVNGVRGLRLEPSDSVPNVIGGDASNVVGPGLYGATIGGGYNNHAEANATTVGGGHQNRVSGSAATIAGGAQNAALDDYSIVAGGYRNAVTTTHGFVGGGWGNVVTGMYGAVGGGRDNQAGDTYTSIGGGSYNTALGSGATVAGGSLNIAGANAATVGGGASNKATAGSATIGGGSENTITGSQGTIGGGYQNVVLGYRSTIAGGYLNVVTGTHATVGGGQGNTVATSYGTVGGGQSNAAGGLYSVVPGGQDNVASGDHSLAAGHRAQASHDGTFVWADSTDADFTSTGPDQFVVRAGGGVSFATEWAEFLIDGQAIHRPDHLVIVAKSGGDFASVQAAIDSITDASTTNPYLVWVAPGVYNETVTMKPYVHLQGAGQEATVISSTVTTDSSPPGVATLILAGDTSLRDLTVRNAGAGNYSVALMASAGTARVLVADVTARAEGTGWGYGIFLRDSGTDVTLQDVTAVAEGAGTDNRGLYNFLGSEATLHGGTFTARGGESAYAIYNYGDGVRLEATNVTALAEGADFNYGLRNSYSSDAQVTLHGGSFGARGGGRAYGIYNSGTGAMLEATKVSGLGEGGSSYNYGLFNLSGAQTAAHGGSFVAHGGLTAYAVYNSGSGSRLEATAVTALCENASSKNGGLYNFSGAEARLQGGAFTGRGGSDAAGIYNVNDGATVEATSVTALGEDSTATNYGLRNSGTGHVSLHGGSFTGRGGSAAAGICSSDSGTTLQAEDVSAAGELATGTGSKNYGLHNHTSAEATVRGGSFTASGGSSSLNYGLMNESTATLRGGAFVARNGLDATGIYNAYALIAQSVTALGESATNNYGLDHASPSSADVTQSVLEGATYSVYRSAGTITVSNSRLVGGAAGGTITCVGVSRGLVFAASGCP